MRILNIRSEMQRKEQGVLGNLTVWPLQLVVYITSAQEMASKSIALCW